MNLVCKDIEVLMKPIPLTEKVKILYHVIKIVIINQLCIVRTLLYDPAWL